MTHVAVSTRKEQQQQSTKPYVITSENLNLRGRNRALTGLNNQSVETKMRRYQPEFGHLTGGDLLGERLVEYPEGFPLPNCQIR
jgi:hypothetical protein